MKKNMRGITLIELLVVVAFISILAAIFLPRMAVFALQADNAAAVSDLRAAVAAQETLYAAYGGYGHSLSQSQSGSQSLSLSLSSSIPNPDSDPDPDPDPDSRIPISACPVLDIPLWW